MAADQRELIARLIEADQALAEEKLPPSGVHRIANRISQELDGTREERRLRWAPMVAFVAGAALVLAFFGYTRWVSSPGASESNDRVVRAPEQPRAVVTGPGCLREDTGHGLMLRGTCEVVTHSPVMRVQTTETAAIQLDERVVTLDQGTALFDVDPTKDAPVRVVTPAGEILVVGTRFRVAAGTSTAEVDLYEGVLEIHDRAGRRVRITAGEHFVLRTSLPEPADGEGGTFGEAPAVDAETGGVVETVETETVETERAARRRPRPDDATKKPDKPLDASEIVDRVRSLRRRGQYTRAARTLEQALRRKWPKRTADVLSYELGGIIARHLQDDDRACAHWSRHLQRFGSTRYRKQILASMRGLKCE